MICSTIHMLFSDVLHRVALTASSRPARGFLEAAEAENVELQREVIEMKEVLEARGAME